ncbi:hypothetical protein E4U41_003730, partial [Claviceps citrina]
MSRSVVQPNGWVALRMPNQNLRVLQITPHTTISLGKYGSFPSNLLIDRPFHLTYEVQERRPGESFSRLRVVSGRELNEDMLAEINVNEDANPSGDGEEDPSEAAATATAPAAAVVAEDAAEGELALVDEADGAAVAVARRSNRDTVDDSARQTLTAEEIEELKMKGASAGKELIAKLMLSHTAIDQKTSYSLAKYKLLKERKFLRRFTVLPLDVVLLAQWLLEDKDAGKVLEMRPEMMGLLGCWADVHFGGAPAEGVDEPHGGRWLVVDDTGGLLVAAMAERMGILHREEDHQEEEEGQEEQEPEQEDAQGGASSIQEAADASAEQQQHAEEASSSSKAPRNNHSHKKRPPRRDDLDRHYALTNTLTLIHANSQPNLSILRYFDYDAGDPSPRPPHHPLFTHLLPISWLQLVSPSDDGTYAEKPADVPPEVLASWKPNRRGNHHRKRRR